MSQHDDASRNPSPRAPRRRRRWQQRRLLLGLLPLLALITAAVWLAPSIVAHTSLKQKIVSAALADFEGSVSVGSASLGWLSPLSAHDIAAVDRDGAALASVRSLHSERTLLGLLSNRRQPGGFRVEEPALHVVLRPGGSNWEDALQVYLQQPAEGAAVDRMQLQIVGGAVEVRDATGGAGWRVEGLDADLQLSAGSATRVQIRAAGQVQAAGTPAGRASAQIDCQLSKAGQSVGGGQLTWQLDELPVGPWGSLLQRAGVAVEFQGAVSSRGRCGWEAGLANLRLQIEQLRGQGLTIRAPQWLGDDVLHTGELELRGQIIQADSRWSVEDALLVTDFGQLSARGTLPPLTAASDTTWAELARSLQQESVQVSGRLQLKELAEMLPQTLRIRANTQITSGVATFALASQTAGEPSFTARLEVAELAAVESGKMFTWNKPVSAAADFRYSAEGPIVDRLVCQAEFLDVEARGTLTDGSATLRGQLDRLQEEMGRFIELGQLELAGQLDGNLRWQQTAPGQLNATGRLALSGFRFDLPNSGSTPWQEKSLVIDLEAAAEVAEHQITRIASASLQLRSEGDRWTVKLLQPVEQPFRGAAWPVHTQIAGRLETWLPRLQPLWNSTGWELSGSLDLDATATADAGRVVADKVQLQLTQFRAADPGRRVVVDEHAVRLQTAGTWDLATNRLSATDTVLTSSTVAFRAQEVHLQLPGQADTVSASGKLNYRADLGRLTQCLPQSGPAPASRVGGSVTGVVNAGHQNGVTRLDWTADVQDLVYSTPATPSSGVPVRTVSTATAWRETWREPAVRLAGQQRYDPRRDVLLIDALTATADSWKLAAGGQLERLSTHGTADLKGTLDYDLAELTRKLQPSLGPQVKLVGRQQAQFTARGPLYADSADVASTRSVAAGPQPLVPRELAATFGFGWQSVEAFGMQVGAAEIRGALSDRMLRLHPLDLPVSEGRVKAAPRFDLNVQPVRLILDRGPLVEKVLISPEMCQTWLKYVAPLLADATRAEGRFSLGLDGGSLPLPDTQFGSAAGVLAIHAGRVGPGPLAREFLDIARQVKTLIDGRPAGSSSPDSTWLTLPEQQVKFDVRDGRVQHQGLTVAAGDILMRTSGSVGFDQTLSLVAEVPVQDQWIAGKRLLEPLKGRTLQVPIRGTFSKPQIDTRALADLNRQIVQSAAGRVLEDELGRGLQRLLAPRP